MWSENLPSSGADRTLRRAARSRTNIIQAMSRQRKPLGSAPPLGSVVPSEKRRHLETAESAPSRLHASAEPVPPGAASAWGQQLAEAAASAKIINPAAAAAAAADRGKYTDASALGLAARFSSGARSGGGGGGTGTSGARGGGGRDGTPTPRPERRALVSTQPW